VIVIIKTTIMKNFKMTAGLAMSLFVGFVIIVLAVMKIFVFPGH